jgi:hypothetical protein
MSMPQHTLETVKTGMVNTAVAAGSLGTLSIDNVNEYIKLLIGIATFTYFVSMAWLNWKKGKQLDRTGDTKPDLLKNKPKDPKK